MVSIMGSSSTDGTLPWSFPFSHTEWDQTLGAVQVHMLTLHTQLYALQQQQHQLQHQVDTLQGRLDKTSKTARKPPSSDSPFTKPTLRPSSGTRGARKGHPGSGVTLREPTDVQHVYPAPCACGHGALGPIGAHLRFLFDAISDHAASSSIRNVRGTRPSSQARTSVS